MSGDNFVKHVQACNAQDDAIDSEVTTESGRKEQCPNCHKMLSVNGGWFVKHTRQCGGREMSCWPTRPRHSELLIK